jgi:hypothetical protein
MSIAEQLINAVLEGASPQDVLDEAHTRRQASSRRPRKRLYGKKGDAYDPYTGKRKDPRRRRAMKRSARKHRASRAQAQRRTTRKLSGQGFYKKLGRLTARIRRH